VASPGLLTPAFEAPCWKSLHTPNPPSVAWRFLASNGLFLPFLFLPGGLHSYTTSSIKYFHEELLQRWCCVSFCQNVEHGLATLLPPFIAAGGRAVPEMVSVLKGCRTGRARWRVFGIIHVDPMAQGKYIVEIFDHGFPELVMSSQGTSVGRPVDIVEFLIAPTVFQF
jgi:hypothetical protein